MPNYAEGNIRFRGKRENILKFLRNELLANVKTKKGFEERPIRVDEDSSGWSLTLKKDPDTEQYLYFRESDRQYIDMIDDELSISTSEGANLNKDQIIIIDGFSGAWDVDHEFFKRKAQEHKIDIRAFVWEMGMEWSSVITWYRNGEVDETKRKYADWLWDSAMPDYGG